MYDIVTILLPKLDLAEYLRPTDSNMLVKEGVRMIRSEDSLSCIHMYGVSNLGNQGSKEF